MMRDSSGISVPARPSGYPRSVDALVMVSHPARLRGHLGGLDDRLAEDRVRLHLFIFLSCERRRLLKDRIRHADFADVVKEPRELDPTQLVAIDPELDGSGDA